MVDLPSKMLPADRTGQNDGTLRAWMLTTRTDGRDAVRREEDAPGNERYFRLDGNFDAGGAWAGVEQLAELAYLDLLRRRQETILDGHSHELNAVLLRYRDRIRPARLCLTDTAIGTERTRFYALDRAYRLVHGLVGLVLHWKRVAGNEERWTVLVRGFDRAQHLGTRFFAELARRGAESHIKVVVQTGPGWSGLVLQKLGVTAEPVTGSADHDVAEGSACHRDADVPLGSEDSDDDLERNHPVLLGRLRAADDRLGGARIGLKMLALYSRRGYYHEARCFLDDALPYFDDIVGDDEVARINHVSAMNSCLVMTDDHAGALRIIEQLAAPYLTRPHCLANMNYILAMHYLRYAEAKDIDRAEQYIQQAVANIRAAAGSPDMREHPFLEAFVNNGLAFLRVRQGRPLEAVELCRSGYDKLAQGLGDGRHLLHRSVLQYNIAQVHVQLGRLEEGLALYQSAIAMDPNYSEYHNECGNILQKLERYDDAVASYAQAIACSAPYAEVYFNKAVCHTRQERWEDALACFAESLELSPDQPEVFALRAELFEALGHPDEALEHYDRAIDLGYGAIAARVNRAVLHYNNGAFSLALSDMNHVIAQDAREPSHYENRAAIYQALQREDMHRRDMEAAERCREAVLS